MSLFSSIRRGGGLTVVAAIGSTLLAITASAATGSAVPTADADRFYCQERMLGTWFYCNKPKPPALPEVAPALPAPSATEQLDAVTAELRELKARAILDPTPENVTA